MSFGNSPVNALADKFLQYIITISDIMINRVMNCDWVTSTIFIVFWKWEHTNHVIVSTLILMQAKDSLVNCMIDPTMLTL